MPETADRTESLFAAAVALRPAERDVYLKRECSGDLALRDRLLALLEAHDRAGHVIDRPVIGDLDQTAAYSRTIIEEPGTIIAGRYKLLEEIGQGGMGTVWAAEQTSPVRRKVALKLIKAGMDSRSVLARFEAERQALALMDHPNIAKVLDGGLTESSRPFFVMEYVKGVPITEYCDATRLTVDERLNLFIQVCSALQHAHQKGIIHRDLKPSNILVAPYDDKPVPKVIDFGLAKAMHQSLTDKTLYTAHETVLGTPLYMSPEQAQLNNVDVDTRADIYSLGVLLYELLTGTTPLERQRFKEAAWDEIRRMIREEEPPRPSIRLSSTDTLPSLAAFRQTEPAKFMKLVRGDLDWIVMKALEKDRTRRYETANGFARDIQRYLDDEVVEARPRSTRYRIGKFVRKHKAQVMAAGLVFLALLAGIAGTTWGLIREGRANTKLGASLRREQKANGDLSAANAKVQERYTVAVDAIKTFHTGVSEDFLLKEAPFKDLRNRLLKSASDFYAELSALLGKDTDFAARRAVQQSNFELADLTRRVGLAKAALAAHRAVLAARESLSAEPGVNAEVKVDVGRSLAAVAFLLDQTGEVNEALKLYGRSESILATLRDSFSAARVALAACRRGKAQLLHVAGNRTEALAVCKLARADLEVLLASPGDSTESRHDLAETVNLIGFLLWNSRKPAEAEPEFRTGPAIYRKLVDENASVIEFRRGLAGSHFYLANVLSETGRSTEAETEFRTALAIHQSLAADSPGVTRLRKNLALDRSYLGALLVRTARLPDAEAEFRAAVSILERLVDDDPAVTDIRSLLAGSHIRLGDLLPTMARPSDAETEYRKALPILQKLADEVPAVSEFRGRLASVHSSIGILRLQMGDSRNADTECRAAIAILERLHHENPAEMLTRRRLSIALIDLGDVLRSLGQATEAKAIYQRATDLWEPLFQKDPTDKEQRYWLVSSIRRHGLALGDLGEYAGAAIDARQTLVLTEELPPSGRNLFEMACCQAALAGLARRAGSGVSAIEGEYAAAKAIESLRLAIANGYRKPNQIHIETALEPLRNRADFKNLVTELEKNSPAQQKKK